MRRPLIAAFLPALVLAALMSGTASSVWAQQARVNRGVSERPNIVWLVSEDNSIHYMDLYVKGKARTPAISKLAFDGVVFNHAFSNAPVCSVARTTLATGCYGPRIGTQFHRKSVAVPMPNGVKIFSELLTEAGYYTANNSKTDYNAIPGPNVWNDSSRKATWRNRADGQPFFYMQSFSTSHEGKLHFSRKAMLNKATRTSPDDVSLPPYFPNTPTFRYTQAKYEDLITDVDTQIGKVVDQFTADGLLEDTIIFYFGDHGGVLPRGKGYAYESGLHVPLVVRIPEKWKHLIGYERGSRADGFVSFVDFGPTVLNLASVEVPKGMDGRPFLGANTSAEAVEARNEAFGYADRFDEKYDFVRTLRQGRFEYVRNFQPFNPDGLYNFYRYRMLAYQEWKQLFDQGDLNEVQSQFFRGRPPEQLFDVEADPHEVNNLADDPAYTEILLKLRQRMNEYMVDLPDLSFYPESVLVTDAFDDPAQFGQQRKQQIQKYLNVANLQLLKFATARNELRRCLDHSDPMVRYWACITCSAFGEEATEFASKVRELAIQDSTNLVRARAAEFLGLIDFDGAEDLLLSALNDSETATEAGLILNSVALLRDHFQSSAPAAQNLKLPQKFRSHEVVKRRLEYLIPETR